MEINELKTLLELVKKLVDELEDFRNKEVRELPIPLRNELRKIEFLPAITAEGLESVDSMLEYLIVGQATIEDLIKNIEEFNNPPKLADPVITPTQSSNTESSNEKTIDPDSNNVKIDDSIDSMQWLDTTPIESQQLKSIDTKTKVIKPNNETPTQKINQPEPTQINQTEETQNLINPDEPKTTEISTQKVEPTPTPKLTTNSVQRNPQIINQPKTKEIVDIFDGPKATSTSSNQTNVTNANPIKLPKPTIEPKPEPTITLAKLPTIDSGPSNTIMNQRPTPVETPEQPEQQITSTNNDNAGIDFGPFVQK
jgi:hypothetical protein